MKFIINVYRQTMESRLKVLKKQLDYLKSCAVVPVNLDIIIKLVEIEIEELENQIKERDGQK